MQISKEFTRATMDGHGLLGVLFGLVIFLLCLTGTLLVLADQFTVWERPDTPIISQVSPDAAARISAAALAAARAAETDHDVFLQFPTDELPRMTVKAFDSKGGHREWNVDATDRLVPPVETPWLAFVQQLHFNLTIPTAIGRYIVGLFGTLLLASLVTGILAHRRILKDAFRLRRGGSTRLTNADLHNRIGLWALPFHLIVALTGSLLGLAGLITALLAMAAYKGDQEKAIASLLGPPAREMHRAAPLPDVAAVLRSIERIAPGSAVEQLAFEHPGDEGQQVRAYIAAPGHLARNEGLLFDASGQMIWKAGLTDGNAGSRIYGMITPLHYGTYGGVPLKLIYMVLGSGLTVIVATGGNVWLARRRDQGRPAPRLERIWTATLWGQPLILALLVIAAVIVPNLPLAAAYWGLTCVGWCLGATLFEADRLKSLLKKLLGAALLVVGISHLGMWGMRDAASLSIDLVLLLIGVATLRHA